MAVDGGLPWTCDLKVALLRLMHGSQVMAAGELHPDWTVMAIWPSPMIYAGPREVCITSPNLPIHAIHRQCIVRQCQCAQELRDRVGSSLGFTPCPCPCRVGAMAGDLPRKVAPYWWRVVLHCWPRPGGYALFVGAFLLQGRPRGRGSVHCVGPKPILHPKTPDATTLARTAGITPTTGGTCSCRRLASAT